METRLSEHELAAMLRDVLDRVGRGERFVVERNGENLALLSPLSSDRPVGITGKELIARIGNLRMPGDGFAEDIEAARVAVIPAPVPPWRD
jgi:hypothetical protein